MCDMSDRVLETSSWIKISWQNNYCFQFDLGKALRLFSLRAALNSINKFNNFQYHVVRPIPNEDNKSHALNADQSHTTSSN